MNESIDQIMAFSKKNMYSRKERKIARIADALGHPARVKLVKQLSTEPVSYALLSAQHPISKGTLTHHLRVLRLAGIIDYCVLENAYVYFLMREDIPRWVELLLGDSADEEGRAVA